jgi:hypothetical protein
VPFVPADPRAPANRRMSLIVMNREAEERALRGGAMPLPELQAETRATPATANPPVTTR